MRMLMMSLISVVFLGGCASNPVTFKLHETKYGVQVLGIQTHERVALDHDGIQRLLGEGDADVYEYPVLYVDAGESAVIDDTQMVSLPERFEVVEGRVVVQSKMCRLGRALKVKAEHVDGEVITLSIDIFNQQQSGSNRIPVGNGDAVEIPNLKQRSIQTEVVLSASVWRSLCHVETQKGSQFYCVRVFAPLR